MPFKRSYIFKCTLVYLKWLYTFNRKVVKSRIVVVLISYVIDVLFMNSLLAIIASNTLL